MISSSSNKGVLEVTFGQIKVKKCNNNFFQEGHHFIIQSQSLVNVCFFNLVCQHLHMLKKKGEQQTTHSFDYLITDICVKHFEVYQVHHFIHLKQFIYIQICV